jgi:hypothetical protein
MIPLMPSQQLPVLPLPQLYLEERETLVTYLRHAVKRIANGTLP